MDERAYGIYCHKDENFYYYESGPIKSTNYIDKLRVALMARDLIGITDHNNRNPNYDVVTISHAHSAGYNMIPVFANNHIKKTQTPTSVAKSIENIWG